MLNEELLINNKEERDKYINRINVLEQVKNIITLPKLELSTRGQVANYYNVTEGAIRQIEIRHKDEIESDGFRLYKRSEIEKILNEQEIRFKNEKYFSIIKCNKTDVKISNRGIILYTKRAILRTGMLLQESKIAKEVRTRLRETAEKGINIANSIENIEYKGNINNLVYSKDGQAITTSKAISEVTGKDHFHILRDIRQEIEKLNDIHNPNLDSDLIINDFKKVEYIAENGQTYTQYELGEMATMQLMLKYSTEFRAMFILAFQKMKQAINNMFKVKVIESVLPQDNRLRQYIYVIKNPLNETVKIGVANDVEKRIKQLQTGAGIELELIYKSMICSNAFSIEKDVHKHFEEYRTFGEWFKINPTIVINFLEQQTFVLKSEFMKYI